MRLRPGTRWPFPRRPTGHPPRAAPPRIPGGIVTPAAASRSWLRPDVSRLWDAAPGRPAAQSWGDVPAGTGAGPGAALTGGLSSVRLNLDGHQLSRPRSTTVEGMSRSEEHT